MSKTLQDIRRRDSDVASPRARENLPIAATSAVRRKRIVIVGCGFAGIAAEHRESREEIG